MGASTIVKTGLVGIFLIGGSEGLRADPVTYSLQAGSMILDECLECDRAPIERPLVGTFDLEAKEPVMGAENYTISKIDFSSPVSAGAPYNVTGSGAYTIMVTWPAIQTMDLDVEVDGASGIHLLSGSVGIHIAWPFIDIVVTDIAPQDPLHVYTLHIRAAPLPKTQVEYKLDAGSSTFLDDCLICETPSIPIEIGGSFLLGEVDSNSLYTTYRIDGVSFHDMSLAPEPDLKVVGAGFSIYGGEVALTQEMQLLLDVSSTISQMAGAVLASGNVAPGAQFPAITIDLAQVDPADQSHVYSLHLVARPAMANAPFRRGDANGDGTVDLSDAVAILTQLFLGGGDPACEETADADASGARDITDAVSVLGYLFLGGETPPAPGPLECGVPVEWKLGCREYTACSTTD
jgi:hypothetical protein